MHQSKIGDYIHLHFIVLLFGFTGILGKLITIPALPLAAFRMIIASGGLFVILKLKKKSIDIDLKVVYKSLAIGLIVALHWFTFFQSIKLSNVSVALATLSSATLFAAILEPIFERRKISFLEVLLSLCIIIGLILIFRFELTYWKGILVALLSAFLASLFNVLNRGLTQSNDSEIISFFEMLSGALLLSVIYLVVNSIDNIDLQMFGSDILWLIILGLLCTSYAFTAVVGLMKRISAYSVTMAVNLEPIYAIVLAWFIFGDSELMSRGFYIGAIIIVLSIILHTILDGRENKASA